jgi:hypothetical protein
MAFKVVRGIPRRIGGGADHASRLPEDAQNMIPLDIMTIFTVKSAEPSRSALALRGDRVRPQTVFTRLPGDGVH